MLANCSSGIEPVFALAFEKHVTVGKFNYSNEIFIERLKDLYAINLFDEDLIINNRIVDNYGSCKGIDGIPQDIQKVFVTAMDIHWADHVYAESVWQKWISNAIAKTINMPADATIADVRRAYLLAHELGLKGITVYRDGSRVTQVLNIASDNKVKAFEVSASDALKEDVRNLEEGYIKEEVSEIFEMGKRVLIPRMTGVTTTQSTLTLTMAGGKDFMFEGCPVCGAHVVKAEGCKSCKNCGWSACSIG
jgi:ribonucleoside-diphosphate reductase alpha chain